jgi:DNA polymerase I/DNA polymerase-2
VKIYVKNPKDIIVVKDVVKTWHETEKKLEADINYVSRYILEKRVKPLVWQVVSGKEIKSELYSLGNCGCKVIEAQKIKQAIQQPEFQPHVMAFDIEATEFEIGKGQIILLSMVSSKGFKKVLTWKRFSSKPHEIEFVKDEKELLLRFRDVIKKEKPDFLVGYFSDGFDFPYLRFRADHYKIRLDIGWDKSNIAFIRGIIGSAKTTGLVHIDIFKFIENIISPSLQTETLGLNEVAQELIGDKKIKIDIQKIIKEINKEHNMKTFALYNLQDSILTEKLFQKLWPTIHEITRVVASPLFNSSRDGYSQLVEHYLMLNAERFNELIPHRPTREKIIQRRSQTYKGGFVLQPKYALYKNVVVFDFLSFWPNTIATFNISPETLQSTTKDAHTTPAIEFKKEKVKFHFNKKIKALIPTVLSELLEKRVKIKHELKKHSTPALEARAYAFKTLANATYGYFGFFGARWYCIECSASATGWGKFYIQQAIKKIEKAGFNVIYGDTDSVMFDLGKKSKTQALTLLKKINNSLPGRLELELENIYTRGLFVAKRTVKIGAKKKYALLAKDGSIKIRGFETVRRDWCLLAKEVQHKVLHSILKEGKPNNSLKYVQDIIRQIEKRKIPNEKMIIKTQLKKPLESYAAITPHVVIARKMLKQGMPVDPGTIIQFIIVEGKGKKSLVRDRARLLGEVKKGQYDTSYYIERQILPAIENIFDIFNIERKEIIEGKKQKKLGEF